MAVATVEDVEPFGLTKEQIKVLINLYEFYECLWMVQSAQYKYICKKKAYKVKIHNLG